ncbi:hypothetical protein GCM10025783_22460 [Amnibacterium soli]|uniref:Peptidase S8/S53 domain-containing protein n=1 Tax=Amnibacterium soli TaxID=1282736 RepID=A0ABP8Z8Y1_9MICO
MRTRRSLASVTAFVAGAVLVATLAPPALAEQRGETLRLVARVAAGASTPALQDSVRGVDVRGVTRLGHGIAVVTVEATDAHQAAAALNASPAVAGAAPDRRFTTAGAKAPGTTLDTYFPQQWDLWDAASKARAGGYGVDAPRAWTRTRGSRDVVVAVLDTGITPHPDLAGAALAPGYDFVSQTPGIRTGDGDGWDPDPRDEGDACTELDDPSSWHGTFVTGEIAAQRGRLGVAGEAPGVTIEPVRVLGGCGGTEADSIAAVEWASGGVVAGVPVNANPADVISMSLGSDGGACSSALQTAIDDATRRGSIVVAAAGNDGRSVADTSPANCAGVVSVVATTRSGALADYSNRGDARLSPTIAAPGGSAGAPIIGDTWTSTGAFSAPGNRGAIGAEAGTSMATPRVSAAIALLLSVHPGLGAGEVRRRLAATATRFPAGSSCDRTRCGAGIVNAGDLVGAKRVLVHATSTKAVGTARAGHRLTARVGTWRPAAQHVRYRWLRDGKPIAKATGRSYRLRTKDAGHRIAVRVLVQRAGATNSAATSAVRRVQR